MFEAEVAKLKSELDSPKKKKGFFKWIGNDICIWLRIDESEADQTLLSLNKYVRE